MFQGVGRKNQSHNIMDAQSAHNSSVHVEKKTVTISQQDGKANLVAKSVIFDIAQDEGVNHKKKHKAKHGHHDASNAKVASVVEKRKFDRGEGTHGGEGIEAKKQRLHRSNETKAVVDEHAKLRNLPFEAKRDKALEVCNNWGSEFMSTLSIWRPFEAVNYAKLGYEFQSKLKATKNWDSLIEVFEEHLEQFKEKEFSDSAQKALVDKLEPMLKTFKKEYGPKA